MSAMISAINHSNGSLIHDQLFSSTETRAVRTTFLRSKKPQLLLAKV